MAASTASRNVALGVLGVAIGALFLWLALRNFDLELFRGMIAAVAVPTLWCAGLVYWVALALRIARWTALLMQLGPIKSQQVGETLIVGYAVNNILPARLGEIFRADYAKRRFGIGRVRILGSIVIERLLDLCAIVACLGSGIVFFELTAGSRQLGRFEVLALNAAAVLGTVIIGVFFIKALNLNALPLPKAIHVILDDMRRGLASLNRSTLGYVALLSAGVWLLEVAALWLIFAAFGQSLRLDQALVMMGLASLSTLVPTAPGYVGTYQFVFALAAGAFGYAETLGVVVATTIQLVLFGSVTLVGIAVFLLRSIHNMRPVQVCD